jgi:hypothetical protein
MENKCEVCEVILTEDNTSQSDHHDRCNECYEEWGDLWPDQ